ncbi:class A beta-lactamase [Amycolatopsis pigmentata]|uniref:Beta-lactamase n=1 Tax=Amycolatopsis pigmentata TaxID=450801 RepID=A0ABW5G001_9PSEU
MSRRVLMAGGVTAILAACAAKTVPSGPPPVAAGAPPGSAELAALESRSGGRIGVYALDTGTGRTAGYRAGERFLLCSTHKVLAVAAILRLRTRQPGLLDRVIHYDSSQVLEYAPVTSHHVADGMTVSALCEAALTVSDNTAVNLLVGILGGPQAVTAFARTLGDPVTRLDRLEPDLNTGAPGDERDTSTPTAMGADLRALACGDALDPAGRDLLNGWLTAAGTGTDLVRASLPPGWRAGDKSGSGTHGEVNDLAVVWPPGRAPLVIAIYTAPADPASPTRRKTVAEATTIALRALGAS